MAIFVNPTKVITGPDTRWSYCNAWEAKAINGGTPKFSVSLIIPKSDTKTIAKVKAAIQAAYEEGASKLKGSGKSVPSLKAIKTPLRDGDLERPDDEAYANSYFINANSASAPGIVDADRQPIIDHSEVYSGVYGRASINGTYWVESEQKAVAAMMEHTDEQLREAEEMLTAALDTLENMNVSRADVISGGKKFSQGLTANQNEVYRKYQLAVAYKSFVMKYRNMRSLKSALEASKPLLEKAPEELDNSPFLLNTPGGTYDLQKGLDSWEVTNPADYLTKITAVVPSNEGMDLWLEAVGKFFCEDAELMEYVQKICGLCLIGKVYVEALIIAYGDGRNGKSTFWNVIFKVLGSYSDNMSADALTVNCKRNVKPELAELKGKRLIIAAELQEGMKLNTSVVKQLCSTNPIFAEKKFKAPFIFEPSHTLVLYTNHLPKVSASDDGTWRRLIVIRSWLRVILQRKLLEKKTHSASCD